MQNHDINDEQNLRHCFRDHKCFKHIKNIYLNELFTYGFRVASYQLPNSSFICGVTGKLKAIFIFAKNIIIFLIFMIIFTLLVIFVKKGIDSVSTGYGYWQKNNNVNYQDFIKNMSKCEMNEYKLAIKNINSFIVNQKQNLKKEIELQILITYSKKYFIEYNNIDYRKITKHKQQMKIINTMLIDRLKYRNSLPKDRLKCFRSLVKKIPLEERLRMGRFFYIL